MKNPRTLLVAGVLATLSAASLLAQSSFDLVLVGKSREFVRNSAGGPVPNPSNPFGNLGFEVTVSGPSFGAGITAPVVTLPGTSSYPTANSAVHNGGTLVYNSDGEWGYGSPDGNGIATNNLSNLTTYFQHGTYAISTPNGTVNLSLDMSSTPFPVVPNFTFSQGTWTNGILYFDPNQDLTITLGNVNGFKTGAGSTPLYASSGVGGHINFYFTDGSTDYTDQNAFSRVGPPGVTFDENPANLTYTLAANPLNAGKTFFGEGNFGIFLDYNTTGGSINVSLLESITSFQVQAIPEPSTYAAFAGLGALGLAAWRRRRRLAA